MRLPQERRAASGNYILQAPSTSAKARRALKEERILQRLASNFIMESHKTAKMRLAHKAVFAAEAEGQQ
jgi:hypothetical protein